MGGAKRRKDGTLGPVSKKAPRKDVVEPVAAKADAGGSGGGAEGASSGGGGGAAAAGKGKEEAVEEEEAEVDAEVEDGDAFERRRDRELQEEMRLSDREKMVDLLKHFTPEQMNRYECYRRSSLPKPVLKRLFQTITGTILNQNGLIVLATVGKMFVGELIELARAVADEQGLTDLDEIRPAHIREAHRRMDAAGQLFKERVKPLFKNQRL